MGSDNYSGEGRGQDSPSESRGGPGSGAGSSSSGSKSSGGGLNSAGNRSSGAGPGASSNRSTTGSGYSGTSSGGLNSAGNRSSGAGPGASSNRSTTGGGYSGTGGSSMGGGSGMGGMGGLNSTGNRASGAGPGASANRSTTGNGFGGTDTGNGFGGMNSPRGMSNPSLGGGMVSDSMRRADMAQAARASENASMSTYDAARALSQDNAARADLAQKSRTSEEQSMNSMVDWGKQVKSVVSAGPGWTEVELNNGLKETRKGDRASRNNNPGNIEASSWTKGLPGYIGTDGRFAVFSSKEDGINAIGSLLGTSRYMGKTVGGAISSYAPPSENNTAAYASRVASAIGVSKDTPMSSLSAAQRTAMAHAIMGVEGNTGYSVAKTTGTDRFASTYMGGKTPTASTVDSRTATTQEAAKAGLPNSAPVPNARPKDEAAATFGPPTSLPGNYPERPRSIGQKVAAGAIDVGLGMLPGVGTAASVINGGLALTGNRTLGEHVVDSFVTGEGAGAGPNSGADRPGGSGREQIVKNTSTVPKKQENFEDRYIKFVDPTQRPTPAQKWNYDTTGYA